MTPVHSTTTRKFGTLALGVVIAAATLFDGSAALAAGSKKCAALERRLDTKLRRGLKGCAKAVGLLGTLRCSADKRDRHVATLATRGCPSPAWAVRIETVRVNKATVALEWTSRLNWARLLDRRDDPIASTARRPGNRFENVLLLDPDSDLATVVDYVLDVEARASDVEDGLPGAFAGGRRPAFPAVGDRSPGEALDTLGDVLLACQEGEPGLFASDGDGGRKIGGVSGEALQHAKDFDGAPDNGNRGVAFAKMFVDFIDAISDDDEPEPEPAPEPEPEDDEQCQENADGKCNEGGENPDDGQSQPGTDDPEGTPAPADGGQPAPSGTQTPSEDGQRCGGLEVFTAVCDGIEWQSPTCRAFVRHVNGCADEALINPGPEGDTSCSAEGGSDTELRELECAQRGGIALPGPDGQLVCRTADLEQLPDVGNQFDPCNNPEAQGTDEMCAQQGGAGIDLGGEIPTPAPDPRAR